MEFIDVLDQDGNQTGAVKSRSDVHKDGDWHKTVHVWIANLQNQILIQRRSKNKENHPGKWDVSVAGHICEGERSIQAALREVKEELGLSLMPEKLQHLFTVKQQQILNDGAYIDREFHEVFFIREDIDTSQLSFRDGEVAETRYLSVFELKQWVMNGKEDLVPRPNEYAALFERIKEMQI